MDELIRKEYTLAMPNEQSLHGFDGIYYEVFKKGFMSGMDFQMEEIARDRDLFDEQMAWEELRKA